MSAFQEPRYDVSPLPSSPPRRIRRRVWVWAGFVLVSILIGLEASSLRRWTYARVGRPVRDAVIAASTDS